MKSRYSCLAILALCLALVLPSAMGGGYVLHIFGNANMDGTIDAKDVDYLKEIISGKEKKTDLADANYDGKIDEADISQINRIIDETEDNITILDGNGLPVTVNLPIKRAIVEHLDNSEMMMILRKIDAVAGVDLAMSKSVKEFPELSKKASVPGFSPVKDPDYEQALSLRPDIILTFSNKTSEKTKNLPGVPVVFAGLYYPDLINPETSSFTDAVHKLGYIMDSREKAEEYIDWHIGKINAIKSITQNTSEKEKPTVLIATLPKDGDKTVATYAKIDTLSQMVSLAGGKSIVDGLPAYLKSNYRIEIDPEFVIKQDPDYIVFITIALDPPIGYDSDNITGMQKALASFKSRPEYANLTAVKDDHVYIINGNLRNDATKGLIGAAYLAKIFYADKAELDPEQLHQEYLTRFLGLEYDLNSHGVFIYPPLEENGNLEGVPDESLEILHSTAASKS
jgi:iron complex transport system substrate-binding protein